MSAANRKVRRLRRAFARLDPVTREVFRLHVDGLDYAAIAARLGITAEAVERHIAEALIALAERLDRPWWKRW